jgi:protein-S-isoprenylcysteine O-methyltransferase Ste14
VPAFKLGLWNAWIFDFPLIITSMLGAKILGKRKREEGSSVNNKARAVSILYFLIVLLSYAYSVFLPLRLNTIWFIIGLLIYLPTMLFLIIGLSNFAATPVDELVTKGAYSISRNPSYISAILVNIGIGIACLSWVFLLVAIVDFILLRYYVVIVEEPFLLENYGDTYREYMNRTPRWIGLPKSRSRTQQ